MLTMRITTTLICLLISIKCLVRCDDEGEFKNYIALRKQLLYPGNGESPYNPNIRPVKDHTKQTVVKVRLTIMRITSLDSTGLTTDMYLSMTWKDEHLQWNASSFNNLNRVVFGFEELWTPDVIAWNAYDRTIEDSTSSRLWVNSSGVVNWFTKATFKTRCAIDLTDFPFDTQSCYISFGPWMYVRREVNLTSYTETGKTVVGPFISNPEWEYLNISGKTYPGSQNGFSLISITVPLKRKFASYYYLVFVPYLAASLLVVTTFWTPIGSKYRYLYTNLAIGIFVCLLFSISYKVGVWGVGVPYAIRCLSINLLMTLVFIGFSTLMYSQFNDLIRKRVNPPQFMVTILENKWLNIALCLTTKSEKSLVTENDEESASEIRVDSSSKWFVLMELIDRVCCLLYIILWIAFHT